MPTCDFSLSCHVHVSLGPIYLTCRPHPTITVTCKPHYHMTWRPHHQKSDPTACETQASVFKGAKKKPRRTWESNPRPTSQSQRTKPPHHNIFLVLIRHSSLINYISLLGLGQASRKASFATRPFFNSFDFLQEQLGHRPIC